MALTDKDREEIRKTISDILAGSIVGRVENIITASLSAKVANIQKAQVEAEQKTADTGKEMGGYLERIEVAKKELEQLRSAIKVNTETAAATANEQAAKQKDLEDKLALRISKLE